MTTGITEPRLTARITGTPRPDSTDRLVIVTEPSGTTVAVRWRLRSEPWRCKACGPQRTTDCEHTFAAALLLAEQLLGLTPITKEPSS